MNALSGEATVNFSPSVKESILKKNLLLEGANSFFSADTFSEGGWCVGKRMGCHKSCLP